MTRRMTMTMPAAVVLALTIVSVGPAAAATFDNPDYYIHTVEHAAVAHAKASAADIARWNGLAEAHATSITLGLTRAQNADIARWNGLAEVYATSITLGLTRAQNADIARWNGLAEAYANSLSG